MQCRMCSAQNVDMHYRLKRAKKECIEMDFGAGGEGGLSLPSPPIAKLFAGGIPY